MKIDWEFVGNGFFMAMLILIFLFFISVMLVLALTNLALFLIVASIVIASAIGIHFAEWAKKNYG